MSFISERFDVYIKLSLSRRMYIKCVPHDEQTSYCTEYKETMHRTALCGARGIFLLDVRSVHAKQTSVPIQQQT